MMSTGTVRRGVFMAAVVGCTLQIASANLICGWHFNSIDEGVTRVTADHGNGLLDLSALQTSVTVYDGTGVNAFDDDPAGTALGIRGLNANAQWIELAFSAEGPVELAFAFRATPSGFDENQVKLMVDEEWISIASFGGSNADGAWHEQMLVLPQQKGPMRVRLFVDGAESSSGTIRFDNLRVTSVSAPGALLACGTGCMILRQRRQ